MHPRGFGIWIRSEDTSGGLETFSAKRSILHRRRAHDSIEPMATSLPKPHMMDGADPVDPLSKLHKMSTTAGVASQQYVAVNSAAVIAALLGLASGLAIFSPLLLIISVVGIAVAIVAWRQIRGSNGTETGLVAAGLGLMMSVGFGAGIGGKEYLDYSHSRDDGRKMDAIIQQVSTAIQSNQLEAAYQLFDSNFRQRVSLEQFKTKLQSMQLPGANGRIHSMAWNGILPQYEKTQGGDGLLGIVYGAIMFDAGEGRFTFIFDKTQTGWSLLNIVEIFPADRPAKATN
jgi:hypothetical protein